MLVGVLLSWLLCLTAGAAVANRENSTKYFNDSLPHSPPFYPSPLCGRAQGKSWEDAIEKARKLVSQMTLVEKVNLTTGIGMRMGRCSGTTGSVPRLNFPGLCSQDSPLGVGGVDLVTSFPPGISAATSFNKDLMQKRAKAIGKEFKAKGTMIQLGPCIGPIGSRPLGGRGWESFGSDPYLQGIAGAITVEGVQSQGIMTNIKHLIANEQERYRNKKDARKFHFGDIPETLSSNIDDRTMHEVYLWPFADAIRAGAASIMCSYNQINNSYGCQNSYVMNGLVKDELGFNGFIMSDWGATHSGVGNVLAGMDMNMPGDINLGKGEDSYYGANLTEMVLNGTVPEWRVSDMATRIVAAYYQVGLDKTYDKNHVPNYGMFSDEDYGYEFGDAGWTHLNKHVNAQTGLSRKVAHQGALESFVLLKNVNKTLPLKQKKKEMPKKLSVVGLGAFPSPEGANCDRQMCSEGAMGTAWGSGAVDFPYLITPYEALNSRAVDEGITVQATTGKDDIWVNDTMWNTTRLYSYSKSSDMNIIFGLSDAGEGFGLVGNNSYGDRENYTLWHGAEQLIKRVVKLNNNNVIVATTVGPIDMEKWINHPNVTAVFLNTPTGQDFGTAVAELIFGDENPSGRLPFTIAKDTKDYIPIINHEWKNGSKFAPQDPFDDGLFIDYRHFDKNKIEPRFEFGFGLSYTNFSLSDLSIDTVKQPPEIMPKSKPLKPIHVNSTKSVTADAVFPKNFKKVGNVIYPWLKSSKDAEPKGKYPFPEGYSTEHANFSRFPRAAGGTGGNPALFKTAYKVHAKVKNSGDIAGQFVAQLYVEFPQSKEFPSPIRQLRGFEKVKLSRDRDTKVEFKIRAKDLAVWDTVAQSWKVQRGKYTFHVGSSSRKLELKKTITIK